MLGTYATEMASIIRDLDDLVAERLRLQAELHGVSIEQEARRILTEGITVTRKHIAAEAAAMRAAQRPHRTRAVDLIREDRER